MFLIKAVTTLGLSPLPCSLVDSLCTRTASLLPENSRRPWLLSYPLVIKDLLLLIHLKLLILILRSYPLLLSNRRGPKMEVLDLLISSVQFPLLRRQVLLPNSLNLILCYSLAKRLF